MISAIKETKSKGKEQITHTHTHTPNNTSGDFPTVAVWSHLRFNGEVLAEDTSWIDAM